MRIITILKIIKNIFNLIRYKDWVKNIIIFFFFVFNESKQDFLLLYDLFFIFVSFSIICSIIYILNDLIDIESDKIHSYKKKIKPLANGSLSKQIAFALLFFLLILCMIIIFYFKLFFIHFFAYAVLLVLYNVIFKKIIILDVFIISLGYLIRLDLGSNAIDANTSINLLACIYFLVSFILFIKRYVEFSTQEKKRSSLKLYNFKFLNYLIITSGLGFVMSCVYFIIFDKIYLIIILPLLIFNLYKYYKISIYNNLGEFPIDVVLKNRILLINTFIILFAILIIYLVF